jgi:hypothetical protein
MSGESRYAFNRLGLNQLVCYTWTKDKRVTHLTITRVMEKPCPLSTDVQVIENLQESILKSIVFSPCPVARTDPKRFCHMYICTCMCADAFSVQTLLHSRRGTVCIAW